MGNNLFIPSNEPFMRGVAAVQDAQLNRNALARQSMQNQAMSQDLAKRAELEALLRTSQNPERDGYEWAKRNDPNLADKLSTNYIQRFAAKARLDPKNAAMELENATGEKIELGNRYSKLPIEGGEAYVDNFSGHVFQPSNAKELAQIRADFAAELEKQKQEGRKEIEAIRAERPRQDTTATVYEDFRSTDPARRQRAEDYISRQKQPVTEPGSYLPIMDAQGNIRGAWNAKSGTYKEPPVANARKGPLPTTEKKATADIESAETKIRNLGALFNPEYVGPIQGRFNLAKIKTPGVSIDKGLAAFVAQNTTLKNEVIKFITGAQMSEPEAQRIMAQIPSVEDKPEVWQAKYDITLQNIEILKQKMKEAGYVFGGGGVGGAATSAVQRSKSKSGKPIFSRDGGKTWEYE